MQAWVVFLHLLKFQEMIKKREEPDSNHQPDA